MRRVWLGLTMMGVGCACQAGGSLADVQVIDRSTGAILQTYQYRGEYWVAGVPGNRYAIRILNRGAQRLMAVTSIDGVNVISGDTAAWNQSGYVFEPEQGYSIDGWRKSNEEVASFVFTAAAQSYAERTGRPENVGVIGVALFRERVSVAMSPSAAARAAPPPLSPPAPTSSDASSAPGSLAAQAAPAPKLGTGHGERQHSDVVDVAFERLSSTPDEIIRIRYDSPENLLARGVIHRLPRGSSPDAFPGSSRFAPDPPG